MDYGKSFISVFQESSAGIGKIFILGVGLGAGHWALDSMGFRHFFDIS